MFRPYRFLSAATLLGLLLLVVSPVTAQTNNPPATNDAFARLTASGMDHYYAVEYDAALADLEKAMKLRPGDPFAVNHYLEALLFCQLYRAGALDAGTYMGEGFLKAKPINLDPKVRDQLKQLMDEATRLSEKRLDQNPNDTDALYARGVTRGLRATYLGLIEKSWFPALRSAIGARHDHERVLELDPKYTDAKMVVGIQNYIAGGLPWVVKAAVSVVGLSGSKKTGMAYLQDAATNGKEAIVDARVAYALFLRREKRFDESLKIVRQLTADHPKNILFAFEEANLLKLSGHPDEAIAGLRKILAQGKAGYYVEPHLDAPAMSLGELLREQKQYEEAGQVFEAVRGYRSTERDVKVKASLEAGQMFDLAGQRERAVQNYEEVSALDPGSQEAQKAREFIQNPYHGG